MLKKQPTYFLTISKGTYNYIRKTVKPNKNSFGLIHNAIDTSKSLSNIERDLSDIRLVTIGSLVENKGHKFLLKVLLLLKQQCSYRVSLKILGDGPLKSDLLEYAQKNDLMQKLQKEILKLLSKHRLPSYTEDSKDSICFSL